MECRISSFRFSCFNDNFWFKIKSDEFFSVTSHATRDLYCEHVPVSWKQILWALGLVLVFKALSVGDVRNVVKGATIWGWPVQRGGATTRDSDVTRLWFPCDLPESTLHRFYLTEHLSRELLHWAILTFWKKFRTSLLLHSIMPVIYNDQSFLVCSALIDIKNQK